MTMKILIIDDEPTIALVASIALRKIGGNQVISAGDAATGLAMVRAEKPDVVLLDFQLPDMDGLEALGKLQSDPETKNVPVILCTAAREIEADGKVTGAGARGVIYKPFDPLTLNDEIQKILGL